MICLISDTHVVYLKLEFVRGSQNLLPPTLNQITVIERNYEYVSALMNNVLTVKL